MESVSTSQLREMLIAASRAIVKSEPILTQIDRLTGDGDHGIGMMTGFCAVEEMLEDTRTFDDCIDMLRHVGAVLVDTIGGASGVLFGTLFISGARGLSRSRNRIEQMTADDFICFFSAGADAIRKRGRAELGDKTMLDAIIPATGAFTQAAADGESLECCMSRAASSAQERAEATKQMRARVGRAKHFAEASVGYLDAGATSSAILISALADCAKQIEYRATTCV
jgi:dihydroxyacetone kinase-like protein